ncbi:MAG: OprD family outer membrane porin [Candidatus Thiodiazotropha sp.]
MRTNEFYPKTHLKVAKPNYHKFSLLLLFSYILTAATFSYAGESIQANLRVGFIHAEDEAGESSDGSAIGGYLGYITPTRYGMSAGVTFYTTGELFDDENGDFFSSENDSYSILGQAYLQGEYLKSRLKLGRFELDTPHADRDDIRMVPNTFQGVQFTNHDLPDTTLHLIHLDKWAGIDTDIPERFQEVNGDHGITALGALYEGVEQLTAQAWYYRGSDYASLIYLDAVYQSDDYTVGMQFGSQSDDRSDDSGPDGEVWGITADYTIADVTLTAAYNSVSGTVTNGFGGGPYFTSADDHTIDGTEDQKETALGVEYSGLNAHTLGLFHVDFKHGANETDYYANYDMDDQLAIELIYTDMHEDGDFVRLIANYGF